MKPYLALGALLCASSGLATPAKLAEWDTASTKHSHDLHAPDAKGGVLRPTKPGKVPTRNGADTTGDSTSNSWSGAIKYATSGQLITSVAATFTVPGPSVPTNGGSGYYSGSSWVGLGGAVSGDGLWQAGVGWGVSNATAGLYQYTGTVWYQWLPGSANDLVGWNPIPGHVYAFHLNADRPGTGGVTIVDQTNGMSTSVTTSAPTATATLKGLSAEWITANAPNNGYPAQFPNYGTVKYTNVAWGDTSGKTGGNAGCTIIDMTAPNGKIVSQGSLVGTTEVDTNYQYTS